MNTLLIKIQNGDFNYCSIFNQIKEYQSGDYETSQKNKLHKLIEKALLTEERKLNALRNQLYNVFKVDLWDMALEKCPGEGTAEDLYWFYYEYINKS